MAEARGKRLENNREKIVHRVDSRSWPKDTFPGRRLGGQDPKEERALTTQAKQAGWTAAKAGHGL